MERPSLSISDPRILKSAVKINIARTELNRRHTVNAERSIEDGRCYGFESLYRKRRTVNLEVVIEQRVDRTIQDADTLNRDKLEFRMTLILFKDSPVSHPPLLEVVSLNIGMKSYLAMLHRNDS